MLAFVHQDAEWLLDARLDLGMLGGSIDREKFRRGMEELIQDYSGQPLREWSFAEALRISRMGRGQNVRLPANLLVLMRTAFFLESSVRVLDPDFNLVDGLLGRAATVLKGARHEAAPTDAMARQVRGDGWSAGHSVHGRPIAL